MDISGKWKYEEDFGFGKDHGEAFFEQQGDRFSGYLKYTESIEDEADFTIHQTVEGTVSNEEIIFRGTSIEMLSDTKMEYNLDTWEGILTPEGKIVGSSYDNHEVFGVFVLERLPD